MGDPPLLVVALTVAAYWLRVGWMVMCVQRGHRHGAGVVPELRSERLLWLVVVPTVAAWCALPWVALGRSHGDFAVPGFATTGAYAALRDAAALAAVAGFLVTLRSWRRMGPDWRMDIGHEPAALITDGPFGRVRHPIYACSMLMMIATAIVLPTAVMIAVAVVHLGWIQYKAHAEERHLARTHGDAWHRYAAHTGRFLPRLRSGKS